MQPKCRDLVVDKFESTMKDIRAILEADGSDTNVCSNIAEYGLCCDIVELGTFSDQKRAYIRWQLSWGGPADEFRLFGNGDLEYWYLDWFDGAHVIVTGDDRDLVVDIINNYLGVSF